MVDPDPPKKPLVPSRFVEGALVLMAILAAVPAPDAIAPWAIGGKFGSIPYLATVFVLLLWMVRARGMEERRREFGETARFNEAEENAENRSKGLLQQAEKQHQENSKENDRRHQETVRQIVKAFSSIHRAEAVVGATGPVGAPLVQALQATGSALTDYYYGPKGSVETVAVTPIRGVGGATGPQTSLEGTIRVPGIVVSGTLSTLTRIVEGINTDPPRTPSAVTSVLTDLAKIRDKISSDVTSEIRTLPSLALPHKSDQQGP